MISKNNFLIFIFLFLIGVMVSLSWAAVFPSHVTNCNVSNRSVIFDLNSSECPYPVPFLENLSSQATFRYPKNCPLYINFTCKNYNLLLINNQAINKSNSSDFIINQISSNEEQYLRYQFIFLQEKDYTFIVQCPNLCNDTTIISIMEPKLIQDENNTPLISISGDNVKINLAMGDNNTQSLEETENNSFSFSLTLGVTICITFSIFWRIFFYKRK